jgi:hypothetical protein
MPDLGNWGQYGRLRDDVPYGQHIAVRCKNHPDKVYSTKNIAPIGARSLFPQFSGPECECSIADMEVVP